MAVWHVFMVYSAISCLTRDCGRWLFRHVRSASQADADELIQEAYSKFGSLISSIASPHAYVRHHPCAPGGEQRGARI